MFIKDFLLSKTVDTNGFNKDFIFYYSGTPRPHIHFLIMTDLLALGYTGSLTQCKAKMTPEHKDAILLWRDTILGCRVSILHRWCQVFPPEGYAKISLLLAYLPTKEVKQFVNATTWSGRTALWDLVQVYVEVLKLTKGSSKKLESIFDTMKLLLRYGANPTIAAPISRGLVPVSPCSLAQSSFPKLHLHLVRVRALLSQKQMS